MLHSKLRGIPQRHRGDGLHFANQICILNYPKRKAWQTVWGKDIGKFHTSDNSPLYLYISSSAWILFASAHHNMITECGYFVILEVFCLFPCAWVCEGVILLSFYFISVYSPVSFCYVLSELRWGCSLYAISPLCCFSGATRLVLLVPPR
jgi:hypothetical protein